MDIERTLAACTTTARKAGQLLLDYSTREVKTETKGRGNFVSEADKAAEKFIIETLTAQFPDAAIHAEESGKREGSSPLKFIIDPLDGTTNFLHGFPHYGVSIAASWNGLVFAGAVYHPPLDDMFTASLGNGSFLNERKIQVSQNRRISECLLVTGFSYDTGDKLRRSMKMFQCFQDNGQTLRRTGSAALDLAYIASGRFDGYWETGLFAWDCAAGILLVQEAGGEVTDYANNKYELDSPDLLASNGLLHKEMLRRLEPFAT
jgi:myo-inositol-1(or 4)-monophosphatase